jgi:hypothetical protein
MTTKTAMNNQPHFNRIMNWLLTVTKIIAAPCRHTTALCLLSRGLRIHGLPKIKVKRAKSRREAKREAAFCSLFFG